MKIDYKLLQLRWILAVVLILPSSLAGAAPGEHKTSEFRKGVTVNFLYDQPLGGVYSSSWWGRVVKVNGDWRDVYVETDEKLTSTGIISFNCRDANANIGIIDYGNEFGNADQKTLYIIKPRDRSRWKLDQLPMENNPVMPYELFQIVFRRYCRG